VKQRRKQRVGRIYTIVVFSLMALAFAWIVIRRFLTGPTVKPALGDWYMVVPPLTGDSAGTPNLSAPLSQWKVKGSFATAPACEQTVERNKLSVGGESIYGRQHDDGSATGRAQIFAARCIRADRLRAR
jgi:hypothetical protein